MNGSEVRSSNELRHVLDHVRNRPPFFAELIGDNGFKLLLGIGASAACAQFSSTDGSAPYFMAVANDPPAADAEPEFLIGNTSSPVPSRYCLSYDTMVEVAARFVDSGDRHPGLAWEEV